MCPLTVDYYWGYTMPCKKHYSYTCTKGYGNDRLNAGGDEDGRQGKGNLFEASAILYHIKAEQ